MVLQVADLLARCDVEDLRRPIAASGYEAPVLAEAHAAHYALVREVEDKLHVKSTVHTRVEDSVPVLALSLEVQWQLLRVQLAELVADLLQLRVSVLEVRRNLLVLWWWVRASDAW